MEEVLGVRIAILEDDGDLGELLTEALGELGATARHFSSVDALLSADQTFDAYILDWALADGTSQAAVQTLRQRGCGHRVAILTGSNAFHDASLCAGVEGLQVFEKPTRVRELFAFAQAAAARLPG